MANVKISGLTAAGSFILADEMEVNEAGTSKKVTGTQIKTALGPTVPTVVAVTAGFTSTGVPVATLPSGHTTNDILVLVLQSSNDSLVAAPSTYTQLGPQNGLNTGAAALANRLSIFWKRDGGSESAPTIPDTGDHTDGFMFAIRGCPTTGDPFAIGGNGYKFTTSTTGTSVKSVTSCDGVLVVDLWAGNFDGAGAQGSGVANTDLTSVTEQFDTGTADGTGGFLYMSSGIKASAGPVKATTVTWANTSSDLFTRIHFLPVDYITYQNASKSAEIQIFIGSPQDLDDTWVKATGARKVLVQAIGGGGGGSSGHTATTPAGGGGGGGGHYPSDRWFNADDLAATVTVHAGKGGAATTVAVDQAGNNGVNSTFSSTLVVAVAGTGATASASADGGNGGSGGGTTVPAAGAVATIAAGELGTAGGNGATTGVGGSPGEHGGGGGASGTTAANTTVVAGLSKYGGGGGGAGANTGTLTAGGAGGGAAAPGTSPSTNGVDSSVLPYGGSGATGGNATTAPGGSGGFPGGGGGGGGGNNANTQGGRGGHGCIVVTTYF